MYTEQIQSDQWPIHAAKKNVRRGSFQMLLICIYMLYYYEQLIT